MFSSQTRIVTIQKLHHQHDGEKSELQNLNSEFGRYIQHVKDLENTNRQLRNQIDALKKNWGKLLDNSFFTLKKFI
jgi:chromosome segregation ATPase